jgi:hypothetical protein
MLAIPSSDSVRTKAMARLQSLLWKLNNEAEIDGHENSESGDLGSASDDELFNILDSELGIS